MASVTFTSKRNPNTAGDYTALIVYTVTQDIAANRSVITIDQVGFTTSGANLGDTRAEGWLDIAGKRAARWLYFDGNKMTSCQVNSWGYGYIQNCTAFTKYSVTVDHNADGTCSVSFNMGWALKSWSQQTIWTDNNQTLTVALPTIPRASGISAGNTTLGKSTTISLVRYAGIFRETVRWSCGSKGGIIAQNNSQTSIQWTPGRELANQVPNANSAAVTLTAQTYNGSTLIGSKSCVIQCAVPEDMVPTASVSVSDPAGHLAVCGGYVQNQSKARVKTDCAGSFGSTISSCAVTVGGIRAAGTDVTVSLPNPGQTEVVCVVTDSRGRVATVRTSISVLAYENPRISIISLGRCDSDGTPNPKGEYGKAVWNGGFTNLPGNSVRYQGIRKVHGGNAQTSQDVTGGEFLFPADKDIAYDITVKAYDRFTETESVVWLLPVAFVMLDFHKDSRAVGIGMRANTANAVSFGLDLNMDEKKIYNVQSITIGDMELTQSALQAMLLGQHPVGSYYISDNATSPAALWGGTWERIYGRVLYAADDSHPAGSTGGKASIVQTIDQLPQHRHRFNINSSSNPNTLVAQWAQIAQYGTQISTSGGAYKTITDTELIGKGEPMNILNPYLAVYVWHRIA